MTAIAIGADEAGAPLKDHLAKYLRGGGLRGQGLRQRHRPGLPGRRRGGRRGGRRAASTTARCSSAAPAWAWRSPPTRSPASAPRPRTTPYSAERARKSNDAQVLTMGARVIAPQAAEKVLDHWLGVGVRGRRLGAEGREDEGGRRALPRGARAAAERPRPRMLAAVMRGADDLAVEERPDPGARPRRGARRGRGQHDLRHRRPDPHGREDLGRRAARDPRPRDGGTRRRGRARGSRATRPARPSRWPR